MVAVRQTNDSSDHSANNNNKDNMMSRIDQALTLIIMYVKFSDSAENLQH